MKDLVLITSFCPTENKKNILKNLLDFLGNYCDIFDIMVVSHTPLGSDIQSCCDYFIFDKENLLLYDDDMRPKVFFENDDFVICSNYVSDFSTSYAVLKLESMGVSLAKLLGYKKIHKFEYDTNLESIVEIMNNSKLLETSDVVFYTLNGDSEKFMSGNFWSSNVDSLPNFYYKYEKENVLDLLYKNKQLSPEWLIKNFFLSKKYFVKNSLKLADYGIFVGLSHNEFSDRGLFVVPVINPNNGEVYVFAYNNKNVDYKISISERNNFFEYKVQPKNWNLRLLCDQDKFENVSIWVNDKNTINLNSKNLNFIDFKKNNFINRK